MKKIFYYRLLLIGLLIITAYNELLVYIISTLSWPDINCYSNKCTKILLIADPQLLGEEHETFIARFDCDKYLRNTFSMAYSYTEPNGIIFLGDIQDEGSILCNDEKASRYFQRFYNIYKLGALLSTNTPIIIIPGDNDIGGEGNGIFNIKAINLFSKYYSKIGQNNIGNIIINKIQLFKSKNMDKVNVDDLRNPKTDLDLIHNINEINIAITHEPITIGSSNELIYSIIPSMKPEIIFSAHLHKSFAVTSSAVTNIILTYQDLKKNTFRNNIPSWTFFPARNSNYSEITEIIVPTCNYRMGVSDMGFGVVVYDHDESKIHYHVLWLPNRLKCLLLYALFVIISFIIWIQKFRNKKVNHRLRYYF